jgi:hypothetical protein
MTTYKRTTTNRVYFVQYGYLFSMTINDAIKMAQNALEGTGHDLSDKVLTPSVKQIKFRNIDRGVDSVKYGKKYINVNHILDWTNEDWSYFLNGF